MLDVQSPLPKTDKKNHRFFISARRHESTSHTREFHAMLLLLVHMRGGSCDAFLCVAHNFFLVSLFIPMNIRLFFSRGNKKRIVNVKIRSVAVRSKNFNASKVSVDV